MGRFEHFATYPRTLSVSTYKMSIANAFPQPDSRYPQVHPGRSQVSTAFLQGQLNFII